MPGASASCSERAVAEELSRRISKARRATVLPDFCRRMHLVGWQFYCSLLLMLRCSLEFLGPVRQLTEVMECTWSSQSWVGIISFLESSDRTS